MPFNRMPTSGPINEFPAGTFNTLVSLAERNERNQAKFGRKPARDILPSSVTWRNDSGSDAPEGAIIRVGAAIQIDNVIAFSGNKPDTTLRRNYAIALAPCEAGELGECTFLDAALAYYLDSDGTPAESERWGIEPGQWYLRKGRYGFSALGFPEGSGTSARARFVPEPIRTIQGKLGSTLAAATGDTPGGPGTLTLWYFNGTAFVASTITASVYNTAESSVPSAKLKTFQLVDGIWIAVAGGGADGEGEQVTYITDWRYDAASHKVQVKTQTAQVHEPGDVSGWTDKHSLVEAEIAKQLGYDEHTLSWARQPAWLFELGEESEAGPIVFSPREFVVNVYTDAGDMILGQTLMTAYVVDPGGTTNEPVDEGSACTPDEEE